MRVSLSKSDRSFSAAPDRTLLDAALDAGLRLAHSCRSGNCGTCCARLLGGSIDYPQGRPLGLSDAQIAEGYVLLCQARARTDLDLELQEIRRADEVVIKRLPCRVERAQRLAHDVIGLHLRLPAAEEFKFEAGQYVDVLLSGSRRRSFSIASAPHDSKLLELHVRRVAGGEFSERIFGADPLRALLTIDGPHGRFFYRPPECEHAGAAAPMLMIGGGTGYAPLNSLLRTLVEHSTERDITLYWGVRAERDLYADALIRDLQSRAHSFAYVPVLSEPSRAWPGRRGFVHEAVLGDIDCLDRYDIYASGPPEMIAAVRRDFIAHGARASRLFFDSFDYAQNSRERQRSSSAAKS